MRAVEQALEELEERARWFARAKEVRLFHVATSGDLFALALDVLVAQAAHPDNRAPFVVLDEPYELRDDGWRARAESVVRQHAAARETLAKDGVLVPEPVRAAASDTGLATFATALRSVSLTWPQPLSGLVVILAPARIEKPAALEQELSFLVAASALADVRWVLLEATDARFTLATQLGAAGSTARCVASLDARREDLAAHIDALGAATIGGASWARAGAAWPRGVSPPAPERPKLVGPATEVIDPMTHHTGAMPLVGEKGWQLLELAVLRATLAFSEGRHAQAVQLQALAKDLCARSHFFREAALMEMILGTYRAAAKQTDQAIATYESARDHAVKERWHELAAQAELAIGALLVQRERLPDAAAAYTRAARIAREHDATPLAVEALRMAGHVAADAGLLEQATRTWLDAIALVEDAPPTDASRTSAPEAARALAALCRKHGLTQQAVGLESRAAELEAARSPGEPS